MAKARHVVPDGKMWSVKREGLNQPESMHRTQRAAEEAAKVRQAAAGGGEVRIHGVNGKIRDSDTVAPGRDPSPPKDKRH